MIQNLQRERGLGHEKQLREDFEGWLSMEKSFGIVLYGLLWYP